MGIVIASHSISLDGFIADREGSVSPLGKWQYEGELESRGGGPYRLSEASRDVFDARIQGVGACVVGRNTYDDAHGWHSRPPFPWPYFVVTHEVPRQGLLVPFTFVTEGVSAALALAKKAAGLKNVLVQGGDVTRQCIAQGLVDRIDLDLVPVLLGRGIRLFEATTVAPVELEQIRATHGTFVTHLSFRIRTSP